MKWIISVVLCLAVSVSYAYDFEEELGRAKQGNVKSQDRVGYAFSMSDSIRMRYDDHEEKAAYWTTQAAQNGNVRAQNRLGHWYWKGRHVEKDIEMAKYWLQQAAENGNEDSAVNLSVIYLEQGDYDTAIKWVHVGVQNGYTRGEERIADYRRTQEAALKREKEAAEQALFWKKIKDNQQFIFVASALAILLFFIVRRFNNAPEPQVIHQQSAQPNSNPTSENINRRPVGLFESWRVQREYKQAIKIYQREYAAALREGRPPPSPPVLYESDTMSSYKRLYWFVKMIVLIISALGASYYLTQDGRKALMEEVYIVGKEQACRDASLLMKVIGPC